jgi:hypothetical protein
MGSSSTLNVEDASVGRDGDVIVAAIGTDGGGQRVRVVGEHGTAADPTFRRVHRTILRATCERLLHLEWIASKTPAEGVRALTGPRGTWPPVAPVTGERDDLAAGHEAERQRMIPAREVSEALEAFAQESASPALNAPDRDPQTFRDLARCCRRRTPG